MNVANAAATLEHAGKQHSGAMTCTIALALIGELLLCAESGGILHDEMVTTYAAGDEERWAHAEALRLLRNSVCHPGAVNPARGEVAVLSLFAHVEREFKEEVWVTPARRDLAELGSRELATFALRLVDTIGYQQADRWKLREFRRRRRRGER